MKKKIIIGLTSIAVLTIGIIYLLNRWEDKKNSIRLSTDRIFKPLHKTDQKIPFAFTPVYLTLKEDTLSLLNYESQKVLFYDKATGKIIDSLGAGRGESPLENNRMYFYDYDKNYFYSFDVANYSFKKSLRKDGKLVAHYLDSLKIDHAERLDGDNFLVSFCDSKLNIAFGKLDISKSVLTKLPEVDSKFEKIDNSWWIFDGKFDKNYKDGSIFYTTYYSDEIVKMDKDGKFIYKVHLIHHRPLIKLVQRGSMLLPAENSFESVLDTAIDDNYIYVLSNIADGTKENAENRVIDAYRLTDGGYVQSYVLPNLAEENLPLEIEKQGNLFYVQYEESIEIFKTN